MSMSITISIFLITCFFISSDGQFPFREFNEDIFAYQATCYPPTSPCTPGQRCSSNCSSIEICMSANLVCIMQNCSAIDNQFCGVSNETYFCTNDSTSCNAGGNSFQCGDAGPFPDPSDCGQYYCCSDMGVPETLTPSKCDEGQTYDSDLGLCTAAGKCSNSTEIVCNGTNLCSQVDNYLYFLCLDNGKGIQAPYMFHCSSGEFNSTTCVCGSNDPDSVAACTPPTTVSPTSNSNPTRIDPSSSPTSASFPPTDASSAPTDASSPPTAASFPPTDTSSPPTDASSSTTEATPTVPPDYCEKPYEFYPIPNNNCRYCRCTQINICEYETCVPGTYFDAVSRRCMDGTCTAKSFWLWRYFGL